MANVNGDVKAPDTPIPQEDILEGLIQALQTRNVGSSASPAVQPSPLALGSLKTLGQRQPPASFPAFAGLQKLY